MQILGEQKFPIIATFFWRIKLVAYTGPATGVGLYVSIPYLGMVRIMFCSGLY